MMFMEPIVTSSLHIYSSPLGLMPTKTELSCRYRQSGEDGLRVVRGCLEGWPQTLWTATKHSGGVNCVAVSLDGTTIVSGSSDNTLHLWEAKTGAAIGKAMEGHTKEITYIALSGEEYLNSQGFPDDVFLWDYLRQTLVSTAEVTQSMDMSHLQFYPGTGGWVLHPGGKRIFWLPVDLRGSIFSQGNIIMVENWDIPVFDVSTCVSQAFGLF
ncbi:hypothetical protein FRB94_002212 [Tulasnella sp. JGI-2019a]|nr:hypothetical protein FRB94_002212 [Tulasnella sp. JGI-2019a]